MLLKWPRRFYVGLPCAALMILWCSSATLGQSGEELTQELTEAEVSKIEATVELFVGGTSREAEIEDVLRPPDELRTGDSSLAELLFSEKRFLARIGSKTRFRFVEGLRVYILANGTTAVADALQIRSGTVAAIVPPDGVPPQVETPDVRITPESESSRVAGTSSSPEVDSQAAAEEPAGTPSSSSGTPSSDIPSSDTPSVPPDPSITVVPPEPPAPEVESNPQLQSASLTGFRLDGASVFFASHNAETEKTRVLNLAGETRVTSRENPANFRILQPGQTIAITDGEFGPVQTFSLTTFYQTSRLADGLGPGQEDYIARQSLEIQEILNGVSPWTLTAIELQANFLQGLCSLNSLGSFSTLSTNCIEVSGDTPVDTFTDVREVTTPEVRDTLELEVLPPEETPETPETPPVPDPPPPPPPPAPDPPDVDPDAVPVELI